MPIARASILRGPAIVQFDGATFYSKADIKVTESLETFEINVSPFGKADERVKDVKQELTFIPAGEWENLTKLFPYSTALIGASVFGADKPLVVWTKDGKKITYKAAAVTKMPDIILSAVKTLFGPMTFTCIRADNTDWTTAESLMKVEASAYPGDATFSLAEIKAQPYTLTWGAAPWDAVKTTDGVVVSFDLGLKPLEVDSDGVVDMTFEKLNVSAKARPLGITEAQLATALAVQDAGNSRGRSLNAGGTDLDISGTGVFVRLSAAALKASAMEFGPATPRIGECEWISTRTITTGTPDPLFLVDVEAPV